MESFERTVEDCPNIRNIEQPHWDSEAGDFQQIRTALPESSSPENILNQQKFEQAMRMDISSYSCKSQEAQERFVFDDNGKLCVKDGKRVPECTYTINGYKYKTDSQGRIISAAGDLHLKKREGRLPIQDHMSEVGGGDALETDDRGHLVGDQFDGSSGMENLVPMAKDLNRGAYLNLERELASAKRAGKDVSVKINVKYDRLSHRPSRFDIRYTIDGETMRRVLKNGG